MKKFIFIILTALLWASAAAAQQATGTTEDFEGKMSLYYTDATLNGNAHASEYEFFKNPNGKYEQIKSSFGGGLDVEYDPLPQRFVLESSFINEKDYYGNLDYAYRDVVLFNIYTRGLWHNLDHQKMGADDPATPSPSAVDLNPLDEYGLGNQLSRAFIRFKAPDFPFHIYADATRIDRNGTMQQIFLRGYTGGLDRVSQTRDIDWVSTEARVGLNSHFGPVEFDYSHTAKKFEADKDKTLYDVYPLMTIAHNVVPDLTSSSDTMKIHTALTGRFVASATYSAGTKKNDDSGAKADFRNTAGDVAITPLRGLVFAFKYRHYDLDTENPATVTVAGIGNTYSIKQPISSKRDVMAGTVKYRFNDRLTVRGEYNVDITQRTVLFANDLAPLQVAPVVSGNVPNDWDVSHRTLKSTETLAVSYRLTNKLTMRADANQTQVSNPAYADDPDSATAGRATLTWMPIARVIALISYSGVREKRNDLTAELAGGSRKSSRDQALGSLTFILGRASSLTASYLYVKNKTTETLTIADQAGLLNLENGVPYGDKAEVYSLAASHALSEIISLTADASQSNSSGNFRVSGVLPGTDGIDMLSDTRVREYIYSGGLTAHLASNIDAELRYQHRRYVDLIDTSLDGTVKTAMATLALRW